MSDEAEQSIALLIKKIEGGVRSSGAEVELLSRIQDAIVVLQKQFTAIHIRGVSGAPDWREYEYCIWRIGEGILSSIKNGTWPVSVAVLRFAATIVAADSCGKGRQTFVTLLGSYGGSSYSKDIAARLHDPELSGHCVKALIKAKDYAHVGSVKKLLDSQQGWVRTAARAYVSRSRTGKNA